jgi:RNA polymerase sigma-70 factor (ECF subfamily)
MAARRNGAGNAEIAAYISAPSHDRNVDGTAQVVPLDPKRRLVASAREGNRDAFAELYREHYAAIFRLCRFRLGPDVDDVVSEVFLRAWRSLPSYRDVGIPFRAWLYGITRHVIVDELRRRDRFRPAEDIPDKAVEPMTAEQMTLRDAVDLLPRKQRQVVELKFLVGFTNDEVASVLGTTAGAVNAKQWRALKTLANILGGER